jgi:hypothetical protein
MLGLFSKGKVVMARRQNQSKPVEIVHNVMVQNCSLKVHRVPITGRKEYGKTYVLPGPWWIIMESETQLLFEQVPDGGV